VNVQRFMQKTAVFLDYFVILNQLLRTLLTVFLPTVTKISQSVS